MNEINFTNSVDSLDLKKMREFYDGTPLLSSLKQFHFNDQQKQIAEKITNEENKKLSGKIVTEISMVKNYCPAEEYHQKYLEKR